MAVSAALLIGVTAAVLASTSTHSNDRATGRLLPSTPTSLPSFDPATFRQLLAQLRGKPVVVNFWGSWCGPCIKEAPVLATASARYQDRVQFIGVDVLDERAPARTFIRRFGWTYPSIFDPSASIESALGMSGQPVTIFFDSTGNQVFIRSGPLADGEVQRELDKILGS